MDTNLSDVISDLATIENDKLLLWATIYTRKCEMLKRKKIEELHSYFESQVKFYKRDYSKYENQIEEFEKKYEDQISKIIDQYSIQYQYIQNEEMVAESNQKIAVANCIMSQRGEKKAKEENKDVLVTKFDKKICATIQKKLNYDVIIDECNFRLEKCMQDTYNEVNKIFNITDTSLTSSKVSIFSNIKHFFAIKFSGDSSFKKYVLDNLYNKFKNIENDTTASISIVKAEMIIFISQMEKIRKEINYSFNETLNKGLV